MSRLAAGRAILAPSYRNLLAACLTLAATGPARGSAAGWGEGGALTITPFQTATFVGDPEAALLLDGLAEFSTRLLRWTDTPRAPVTTVGRMVKSAYLPFFNEWRGLQPEAPRLTSAVVIDRLSDGYRALTGPRIVPIEVGPEGPLVGAFSPVDLLGDEAAFVPVVVNNARGTPVKLVLRDAGAGAAARRELDLKARQALGFFLKLESVPHLQSRRFVAEVGGESAEFEVPLRRHATGTLAVKVIDETGSPTAARVYLTGADQRAHAPREAMPRIVLGDYAQPFAGDCYFHTAGTFDVELPAGPTTVEAVKGLEYLPERVEVKVVAGARHVVAIRLRRKTDLAREGWYSGDVHVHANLFAETRITPRDVLAIAKAEDLNVVNLLPCNDPRTNIITDRQYFTGRPDAVSERNHIVYFNEEMRNDLFGHVGFLNLKTFVEPAYFGWPRSPFPHDYPGNYPQAAKAKAQGAVVTYVHPSLPSAFPVDIALGVADTIDVMSQYDEDVTTGYWYRLLNCGFRCPISAGTDAFLNIPCHLIPGAGRLYVQTVAPLTYEGWIEGYRRGRSFATNGPLLQFTVNGRAPGDEIRAPAGPLRLEIRATAESIVPMDAVEIIVNGRPVRRITAGADRLAIRVEEQVEVAASAWIALRVRGPGHRLAPNDREVYAHTSPVYLRIGDKSVAGRDDALFFVEQINALIRRVAEQGKFANTAQQDEVVRRLRQGQEVYRTIAAAAGP